LSARHVNHLFLEGGPTLAAAFLSAGLVDEVVAYVAPMLLGRGLSAVGDLGVDTIGEALHLDVTDVTTLGTGPETNLRLTMSPVKTPLQEA
jgi:diaminohydroxyphosphoribosylaminopyrimidine deaminase/5-amino-6-(5-phosphoribosylamino)uracil reductase